MTQSSTAEDQLYTVRIPEHFLDKLHEGEITAAEWLTLSILHKWANWKTGRVRNASAGGLRTWSHKAYSERTFSEALRTLELRGHLTRHMVHGSHEDYPITLHNYPVYDDAGNLQMINPKDTLTWKELEGRHGDEPSDEGSDEASDETSDKVLSSNLSQNKSENESQLSSKSVSEKDGSPRSPSFSQSGSANPELEPVLSAEWVTLLHDLMPRVDDGKVFLPQAQALVKFRDNAGWSPDQVRALWDWNQTHKSGKLKFYSLTQAWAALNSNSHRSVLNQWDRCKDRPCPKCKPTPNSVSPLPENGKYVAGIDDDEIKISARAAFEVEEDLD